MSRRAWLAEKRSEIATLRDFPLTDIVPSRRDFTQFIATQKQGVALVPRLQRLDPATGGAWPGLDLATFARACDDAEAGALAVRTAAVFGASLADLDTVAAAITAPLLRDDLCLDRQQVYQARLHGADAVLLPAGDLDAAALRDLAAVASSTHMASVIEVTNSAQLSAALNLSTACIGLGCQRADGRADAEQIVALAALIPRQRIVLLLAEVAALDDLLPFASVIDAAVVGDALLGTPDPAAAITAFLARVG